MKTTTTKQRKTDAAALADQAAGSTALWQLHKQLEERRAEYAQLLKRASTGDQSAGRQLFGKGQQIAMLEQMITTAEQIEADLAAAKERQDLAKEQRRREADMATAREIVNEFEVSTEKLETCFIQMVEALEGVRGHAKRFHQLVSPWLPEDERLVERESRWTQGIENTLRARLIVAGLMTGSVFADTPRNIKGTAARVAEKMRQKTARTK